MIGLTPVKTNKLDEAFPQFVRRYRYEIIASLALVTLIGGVVLGKMVYHATNKDVTQVEVVHKDADFTSKAKVDIQGAVHNPGVYEVVEGQRIHDLIQLAGGYAEEADLDWISQYINLAEQLVDGQKVFIPWIQPTPNPADTELNQSSTSSQEKVNINRASLNELIALPGIGEVYAQRIIDARPYQSIEGLKSVAGIGSKRYEQLKEHVTVY